MNEWNEWSHDNANNAYPTKYYLVDKYDIRLFLSIRVRLEKRYEQ